MDQIVGALVMVAVGIIGAVGSIVLTLVPRAMSYFNARIHGENVLLLRGTIENAAALAVRAVRAENASVDAAIAEMVVYVRDKRLPETVKKLQLTDAALFDMCLAAFVRVSGSIPADQPA